MHYAVTPLQPDPEVAAKAYRFLKLFGDRCTYDVQLNGHGPECECKGFLRWRKPCKHILCLVAAGMFPPIAKPQQQPTRPSEPTNGTPVPEPEPQQEAGDATQGE